MSENKVKLPIDQVSPGMRLAAPIMNASGVTLMPAGIRLAPMFINHLKKWNVAEVTVLTEEKPEPAVAGAHQSPTRAIADAANKTEDEFARDVMRDLNERFANVQDNPLMAALRDIAARKIIALGPDSYINTVRQQEGQG